jgi:hypothetical protein
MRTRPDSQRLGNESHSAAVIQTIHSRDRIHDDSGTL